MYFIVLPPLRLCTAVGHSAKQEENRFVVSLGLGFSDYRCEKPGIGIPILGTKSRDTMSAGACVQETSRSIRAASYSLNRLASMPARSPIARPT